MSDSMLASSINALLDGTSGQVVVCQGAGSLVTTSALKTVGGTSLLGSGNIAVGSGDVVGPASATDNAVVRFDATTGKLLQNSTITASDAGVITCAGVTSSTSGVSTPIGGNGFSFANGGFFLCSSNGVFKFADNTDAAFNRLQLGGTTSSYPAIKRSSAALAFRLADDSADASITAASITASDAVNLAQKTIATLPSAAASNGQRFMVTDSAVQTGRMAYCYGSVWRYEDGSAV